MIPIISLGFFVVASVLGQNYYYPSCQRPIDTLGGGSLYNLEKQKCCHGKLYDRQMLANDSMCCNTISYNSKNNLCCNDKLFPKELDTMKCCGSVTYDSSHSLCCKNKVISIPDSVIPTNAKCCVNQIIDFTKSLCCSGKILSRAADEVECCNGKPFNPKEYLCCQDLLVKTNSSGYQCCHDKVYNPSNGDICCKDYSIMKSQIYPTGSKSSCCGINVYNPRKELCCYLLNGTQKAVAKRKENQLSCCDGIPFSTSEQFCCNGKLRPRINMGIYLCCGDEITEDLNMDCCNNKLFDKRKFLCDRNGVTETTVTVTQGYAFCGAKQFDPSKNLCCNGTIHAANPNIFLECCGKETYEFGRQDCCGGEVIDKADPTKTLCCTQNINDDIQYCPPK